MTVQTQDGQAPSVPLSTATVTDAHWLPFASVVKSGVTPCDVEGYFTVAKNENDQLVSTFRGRNLLGMTVPLAEFTWYAFCCFCVSLFSLASTADGSSRVVENLTVWNHDDMPLRSDVVPQSIALARIQNYLGSLSGIE